MMILAGDFWKRPTKDHLRCLVSIGTGKTLTQPFGTSLAQIGKTLVALSTETEKTAELFAKENTELSKKQQYFRFNVDGGLANIGLEETKRLGEVVQMTRDYVQQESVYQQLGRCAVQLVSATEAAELEG